MCRSVSLSHADNPSFGTRVRCPPAWRGTPTPVASAAARGRSCSPQSAYHRPALGGVPGLGLTSCSHEGLHSRRRRTRASVGVDRRQVRPRGLRRPWQRRHPVDANWTTGAGAPMERRRVHRGRHLPRLSDVARGMSAPEVPAAPPADLAVVVVNYNAGEYLARCVTSVVEASGGLALDLLVVDNASRDRSARVAAERTPQVRLIENPTNRGLSAGWNQGARAVDAPWILFLNADAEIW